MAGTNEQKLREHLSSSRVWQVFTAEFQWGIDTNTLRCLPMLAAFGGVNCEIRVARVECDSMVPETLGRDRARLCVPQQIQECCPLWCLGLKSNGILRENYGSEDFRAF